MQITKITELDGKRHIALLDTSSISFMQGLSEKGLQVEAILKDYDLILIPEWVLTEINDAPGRADYVQKLIDEEYPIYCIEEGTYTFSALVSRWSLKNDAKVKLLIYDDDMNVVAESAPVRAYDSSYSLSTLWSRITATFDTNENSYKYIENKTKKELLNSLYEEV